MSEHTPTPWKFEKLTEWPFGVRVIAGDDVLILRASSVCHSSEQKTRQDCEAGLGFPEVSKYTNRAQAVQLIAEQDANAEFIVRACNSFGELLAALKHARYRDHEHIEWCDGCKLIDKAIQKAEQP